MSSDLFDQRVAIFGFNIALSCNCVLWHLSSLCWSEPPRLDICRFYLVSARRCPSDRISGSRASEPTSATMASFTSRTENLASALA